MPVLMSTPSPKRHRDHLSGHSRRDSRMMRSCSPAERLRLRPWLEKKIEEQSIPGLEWIDENARIVKIPWKHAARHGWQRDKDASLFKEWAIHTKKYDPESDEPKANPKTWKANFRCAINSLPDIEELKDQGKSKGNDAFKVYRLHPKKPKKIRTVSETIAKKPKSPKTSKPKSKPYMKLPTDVDVESPRVSITCTGNVSLNVIPSQPPPPPYESAIRERGGFQLTCNERRLPTGNERLPPVTTFQYPYAASNPYANSRIPPTPNTPCSTVTTCSPLSTPSSTTPVSSPVFTYNTAPFAMHTAPSTVNIKQEPKGSFDDTCDDMSDSGSNMTDEEVIDMVDQMREESNSPNPLSPSRLSPTSLSTKNEWMTSTLDDKQFFSNIVTSKAESIDMIDGLASAPSSFQSAMNYPPTSTYCGYPPSATTPIIKEELKPECMSSCMADGESLSSNGYVPDVTGFTL